MSITKAREFIEKPGCGYSVAILLAVAFASGLSYSSCQSDRSRDQGQASNLPAVLSIGDTRFSAADIERLVQRQSTKSYQPGKSQSPYELLQTEADTLNQLIISGAQLRLAKANGIVPEEAEVLVQARKGAQVTVDQTRRQLVQYGLLKPGYTEQQFEETFRNMRQFPPKEFVEQVVAQTKTGLSDPALRPLYLANVAVERLTEKWVPDVQLTEDQVKKEFDQLVVKSIKFQPEIPGLNETEKAKADAQKALREIEGGLSFEAAIAKYSKADPTPGKKLAETTRSIPVTTIGPDQYMGPLLKLKPGEVSPIIQEPGGPVLYKLIKVESRFPADWDKRKAEYMQQFKEREASKRVQATLDREIGGPGVRWDSVGYRIVYEYRRDVLAAKKPLTEAERIAKAKEFLGRVENVASSDAGWRAADLVAYAALEDIWKAAKPEERKSLAEKRIQAIEKLLQFTENADLRMTLFEMYMEAKDKRAVEQLTQVASANNDTTASGQKAFGDVARGLDALKRSSLATPSEIQTIQTEQDRWLKDKAEADKVAAEQLKQQEAARKQAEADRKKQADEAKKNQPKPQERKAGG